eukprot:4691766-Amphidinium_carterae.2
MASEGDDLAQGSNLPAPLGNRLSSSSSAPERAQCLRWGLLCHPAWAHRLHQGLFPNLLSDGELATPERRRKRRWRTTANRPITLVCYLWCAACRHDIKACHGGLGAQPVVKSL